MSNIIKWRFPSNSYASTTGLDTADLETFRSDINAALAREITQNSIDAKNEDSNKPVRIEFKKFNIENKLIPGYEELIQNIKNCIEYWEEFGSDKTVEALKEMLKELSRKEISCLRISDYNTTGLIGISKNSNSPWHNLIHGTGVSEKSSTSGGSKGIGKFATFVNSYFRTVFYFTKTKNNEYGYEGICKLCSGKIPGTDQLTQGIGYFGLNDKNEPIIDNFYLDKNHQRDETEYGTDIYVLGFKSEENWKEEIICKVLDSFISAIAYETLEIVVDKIKVNKDTLKDIVYNNKIVRTKQNRQKILSQYLLLTDPLTHKEEIEVDNLGKVELFVRSFDSNESDIATNKCTMIRYPYMKIKDQPVSTLVKISALCIIPNNRLNIELRKIENPQHIDWEFNRIENIVLRNDFKNKISKLYKRITEIINNYTLKKSQKMTELEGSEEFISAIDDGDEDYKEMMKNTEKVNSTKLYRPKTKVDQLGEIYDPQSEYDLPSEGQTEPIDYEKEAKDKIIHDPRPRLEESHNENNAMTNTYKKIELRGIKFRFMSVDSSTSTYLVSFESDRTLDVVEISITAQDEGNFTIPLNIYDCYINDVLYNIDNSGKIVMNIVKGQKYDILFKTTETELFACWVKAYAYKK